MKTVSRKIEEGTRKITTLVMGLLGVFVIFLLVKEGDLTYEQGTYLLSIFSCSTTFLLFNRRRLLQLPHVVLPLLLYFIWLGVTLFFTHTIYIGTWETIKIVSFFLLFLTCYNLFRKIPDIDRKITYFFSIIFSLAFFKDFYYFFSWGNYINGKYFAGSFSWHNQMAAFLLLLIPLLLSICFSTKNKMTRLVSFLAIILAGSGMILTYSRAGWLCLIASLTFYFFILRKKLPKRVILLTLATLLLLIGSFFITHQTQVAKKAVSILGVVSQDSSDVSGNLRWNLLKNSLLIIRDYPIFGVGFGGFGKAFNTYQTEPWLYSSNTHNYFLRAFVETGIAGGTLLASFIIVSFASLLKSKKQSPPNLYQIGILAALLGAILHTALDFDWTYVSLFSFFWILLAAIIAIRDEKYWEIHLTGVRQIVFLLPLGLFICATSFFVSYQNHMKGKNAFMASDILSAKEYLKEATLYNPFDDKSYYLLGKVALYQNNKSEMMRNYRKAISLSPFTPEYYFGMGEFYFYEKQYQKAEEWYSHSLQVGPYFDPKVYNGLASTYAKQNKNKKAEELVKLAVAKRFPFNESYQGQGYIFQNKEFQDELARLYYNAALYEKKRGNQQEVKHLISEIKQHITIDKKLQSLYENLLQL